METFLLTVALSVISASSICAETEDEFFSPILDALPKATPGEFKTPNSVARYFVQEIINNRIQNTFRCLSLGRMFAVETFENSVSYVGNTYSVSMGLREGVYGRYLKLVSDFHYMPVQKCRVALLLADDQSKTSLVKELQRPSSKDPKAVNQWLETLSKDLSFRALTNPTISSVKSEPGKTELRHLGVLPFKDIHLATVQASVRGSDIAIEFLVGLVDGNYHIRSLLN